jgi:glycosyltransferase involved in cell wall biosynthesis
MAKSDFRRYVLVTPVRNEELTLDATLQSVIGQTVRPAEWVIVSDESTDRTDEILTSYAAKFSFIQPQRLTGRPARSFASVVFAVGCGVAALKTRGYDFIGLLDADVRFTRDYFEQLLDRFAVDPHLGLAGGLALDLVNGRYIHHHQNLRDVSGAVQFFHRKCFESLGGLTAIPEGGWDTITCVRARMNGFGTATFPELIVDHLKSRNIFEGNLLRRNWQLGVRDHALGYHPLFLMAKCCARILERPPIVRAAAHLIGSSWAALTQPKRRVPPKLVIYIRQEQLARLMSFDRL